MSEATSSTPSLLTAPTHIINLSTAGVLVDVKVRVTTFSKSDRKIADKAATDAGAKKKKAVRASRDLFVDDPVLKNLLNFRQTIANWMKGLAYPWCSSSDYLPYTRIPTFLKEYGEHDAEFQRRLNAWGDRYEQAINDMSFELGALFNRAEYPTREAMLERFGMSYVIMEIPQGDYRCAISNELAADLQTHYNRQAMNVITDMQKKQHAELLTVVQSIAHCCGYNTKKDKDGKVKTTRRKLYRDTLTKALELCNVFESFNAANDPLLDKARAMLNAAFDGVDIDTLKDSDTMRQSMQEQMHDILKMFNPAAGIDPAFASDDADNSPVDLSAFGA